MNDDPLVEIESRFSILVTEYISPSTGCIPYDAKQKEHLEDKFDVRLLDKAALNLLLASAFKLGDREIPLTKL